MRARFATQKALHRVFGAVEPRVPPGVKARVRRSLPRPVVRYVDPLWYRRAIGGKWEELGRLQFEYLLAHGLEPHHYFLDVGCGPLRGGVHFVSYLEPGRYFGIDRRSFLFEAGREFELRPRGLLAKNPTLVEMEDFDFGRLGQTFDYALAQSVYTHLTLNQILRCHMQMEKVLAPGAKFFVTFYENAQGKRNLDPVEQTSGLWTHFDHDPFHYDFDTFTWVCEGTGLDVEYLGDWNNPRNQKMIVFTKRARAPGPQAAAGRE
jgi:SAM-dependent methyltransferase